MISMSLFILCRNYYQKTLIYISQMMHHISGLKFLAGNVSQKERMYYGLSAMDLGCDKDDAWYI